jgi:hypothetical protein
MGSHGEKVVPKVAAMANLSPYIVFPFLGTHSKHCHAVPASIYLVAQCGPSGPTLMQAH